MPAPPVALERDFSPRQKRVNTCGRSSAGMPMPVSATSSVAVVAVPRDDERDAAARVGVAEGVREEVDDDLLEALGLAVDDDRLRLARQGDGLAGERVGERVGLRLGESAEIDGLLREQEARPLGVRQRREVVEQARQAQRLVVHGGEVGGLVVQHAVLGGLDAREQAHHRRAQLVREVGDALLAQRLLLLERLGEAVERLGDGADLVVAALRHAGLEVAGAHRLGARADAPQRPRQRHREVERDGEGDRRRGHAGDQIGAQQLLPELELLLREELAVVAADVDAADLLRAGQDRRGRRRARLRGSRRRMLEHQRALGVVEPRGERIDLREVVQGLDAPLAPAAAVRHDGGDVAEMGRRVLQSRPRRGLEARGQADARVDGRDERAEQRDRDEGDHEACPQTRAHASAHSLASR